MVLKDTSHHWTPTLFIHLFIYFQCHCLCFTSSYLVYTAKTTNWLCKHTFSYVTNIFCMTQIFKKQCTCQWLNNIMHYAHYENCGIWSQKNWVNMICLALHSCYFYLNYKSIHSLLKISSGAHSWKICFNIYSLRESILLLQYFYFLFYFRIDVTLFIYPIGTLY